MRVAVVLIALALPALAQYFDSQVRDHLPLRGQVGHVLMRLSTQDPPVAPVRRPLAVRGGKIYTISGAVLDAGTVLIEGGRIKAVGKDVATPGEATVIDAGGKVVLPGLVDTGSMLYVYAREAWSGGSAEQDVLDGLDIFRDEDRRAPEGGVTTAFVRPLGRGTFAGLCAALHLIEDPESTRFVLKRGAALKMTLGFSGGDTSSPAQRRQDYRSARQAFEGAQQYREGWDKYKKDLAEYQQKKKQWDAQQKKAKEPKPEPPKPEPPKSEPPKAEPPKSEPPKAEPPKSDAAKPAPEPLKEEPKKPQKPATDPRNEILLKALDGQLPVHIEAHAADSIEHALSLAAEFKLKAVLEGATEAHLVAEAIAQAKVPVLIGPVLRYGIPKVDFVGHTPDCAAVLAAAGVEFAIGSFPYAAAGHRGPGAARFLLDAAAVATSRGLPPDRALRAITLDAAKIVGLDRTVGSIDAGKAADLVILSGEPFDAETRVERVIVAGATVYPLKSE